MAHKKKKYFTLGFSLLLLVVLWMLTRGDTPTDIEHMPEGSEQVVTPPAQAPEPEPEAVLIRGVVLDDIESSVLDPDFNFGKGRLGAFTFTAPRDGNFRIEELSVAVEGVRSGDIDSIWLSVNGVNLFSTAALNEAEGRAVFAQFPPISSPGTRPEDVRVAVETETLTSPQQTQRVIVGAESLPQVIASGDAIRMVLYGHWGDDVAARPQSQGIRLCLLGIKGSLIVPVGEDQFEETAAETKFAAPECWEYMGIE